MTAILKRVHYLMFVPSDERHGHAIREAVFAVSLTRPPGPVAIQKFIEFGKTLDELPAFQPFQLAPLPIFSNVGGQSLALSFSNGASFQSFKLDGQLSWRLVVHENQIAVNCLDYETWDKVWPRAMDYLIRTAEIVSEDDNPISNALLQYINAFHWKGANDVIPDFTELLNARSDHIPTLFWTQHSREWHLNQGWFEGRTSPLLGRALSRQHLASQEEQNKGLTVMVDLMERYDPKDPISAAEFFDRYVNDVFGHMRRHIRSSLREYLNEDVSAAIGAIALS